MNSPSCCEGRCLNLSKQLILLKQLTKISVTQTEGNFALNLIADAFTEGKGAMES